jgi:hypothetical protein
VNAPQSPGVDPVETAPETTRTSVGRRVPKLSLAALRPSGDVLRIVALWAAWLVIICTFQIVVEARLQPQRPDNVLAWTGTSGETSQAVLDCRPRLDDSAMNEHVAFDSEYYISIAASGYNDPQADAYSGLQVPDGKGGTTTFVNFAGVPSCAVGAPSDWTSLDYAFMPGYPMTMRPFMAVEGVLPFTKDLTETGRATLAGIIVSALGGLLAMLALARLMAFMERRKVATTEDGPATASKWGGSSGLRTALYLLVFPTGFYLAQVYADGLFIGLAFMACALAVEKRIVPAAIFAVLAALVRTPGVFLVFPLGWAAFQIIRDRWSSPKDWRLAVPVVATIAPVLAFLAWYQSYLGSQWRAVEKAYFTRSFDLGAAWNMWVQVWNSLATGVDRTVNAAGNYRYFVGSTQPATIPLQSATNVYIALELFALVLGIAACIWLFRRMPGVALFGLGVIVLSAGSSAGAPQGMIRYVLAVPAIFLMLGSFGRWPVFDRAWVLGSTLVMGMLAMLFTFGFWVS